MTKKICFLLFVLLSMQGFAQTGIGTSTPHASAKLEVASTTMGFLPPRMTSVQRLAISNPAEGLMVYQTDGTTGLYYRGATDWIYIINSSNNILPVLNGGTGTTTGSITGSGALTFTAGGSNQNITLAPSGSGNVVANSRLGIGTNSPGATLEIGSINGSVPGNLILNPTSTGTGIEGAEINLRPAPVTTSPAAQTWVIDQVSNANNPRLRFFPGNSGESRGFSVLDNGNLGIGTATPASKLNLVGGGIKIHNGFSNTTTRPGLTAASIGNYEIRGVGSITGSSQEDSGDDGFLRLSAGGGTNTSAQSSIDLSGFSTQGDMANNIVMRTAGAERLRIDNSGNVNINGSLSIGNPSGNVVTKAAGFVNAGTFITLGNLRATVSTSGSRGLSLATVTGTLNLLFQGVYTNINGAPVTAFTSSATAFTTTPSGSLFGWSFGSPGNTIIYHLTDATNESFYRVTLIIMHDYIKNFISIERLL